MLRNGPHPHESRKTSLIVVCVNSFAHVCTTFISRPACRCRLNRAPCRRAGRGWNDPENRWSWRCEECARPGEPLRPARGLGREVVRSRDLHPPLRSPNRIGNPGGRGSVRAASFPARTEPRPPGRLVVLGPLNRPQTTPANSPFDRGGRRGFLAPSCGSAASGDCNRARRVDPGPLPRYAAIDRFSRR
jgi:hypothetical protein